MRNAILLTILFFSGLALAAAGSNGLDGGRQPSLAGPYPMAPVIFDPLVLGGPDKIFPYPYPEPIVTATRSPTETPAPLPTPVPTKTKTPTQEAAWPTP